MSLRQHLTYLHRVLVHKGYVGLACIREGLYLRALTHDLSKFRPSEWRPYRAFFNGDGERTQEIKERFDLAWLRHQHRNPHHHQHWVLRQDDGTLKVMPMSDGAVLEMVCDWYGAGAAYTGEASWARTHGWYEANKDKMVLHPDTRARVEALLVQRARRG